LDKIGRMKTSLRRETEARAIPRKPMAKATRVTLFEREVRERLSDPAVELFFRGARVLSEGQLAPAIPAGKKYYGTTMITVDLAALGDAFRERCDAQAARKVAQLMAGDARIGKHARRIAEEEASRRAGGAVKASASDVRVRAQGSSVFVDVDLEGALSR